MSELFSAGELIRALLNVGKSTYKVAKFGSKIAYGAYAKGKEKEEIARLQKQAMIDGNGNLERDAKLGYTECQYEYGLRLYCYGEEFNIQKDIQEGLQWIQLAADNGYSMAEAFLMSLE